MNKFLKVIGWMFFIVTIIGATQLMMFHLIGLNIIESKTLPGSFATESFNSDSVYVSAYDHWWVQNQERLRRI